MVVTWNNRAPIHGGQEDAKDLGLIARRPTGGEGIDERVSSPFSTNMPQCLHGDLWLRLVEEAQNGTISISTTKKNEVMFTSSMNLPPRGSSSVSS